MKDILEQMTNQPSSMAPDASQGFPLGNVNVDDLFGIYDEQQDGQRKRRAQEQLQAIQAVDIQLTQQLSMQHWANQQITALKDRLDLGSVTPEQRQRLAIDLLPVTRELFANLEKSVAISIQLSAIKLLLIERGAPQAVAASAPVAALQGVAPLYLSPGK